MPNGTSAFHKHVMVYKQAMLLSIEAMITFQTESSNPDHVTGKFWKTCKSQEVLILFYKMGAIEHFVIYSREQHSSHTKTRYRNTADQSLSGT